LKKILFWRRLRRRNGFKETEQTEEDTSEGEENGEEFSLEDYLNEEDIPVYRLNPKNYSKDENGKRSFFGRFIIS